MPSIFPILRRLPLTRAALGAPILPSQPAPAQAFLAARQTACQTACEYYQTETSRCCWPKSPPCFRSPARIEPWLHIRRCPAAAW